MRRSQGLLRCALGYSRRRSAADSKIAGRTWRRDRAMVLLEVVLSLVIFVSAAGVVVGSMYASMQTAKRLKVQAQAVDLAVTRMSELQMDPATAVAEGPAAYEDESLADWTWQVAVELLENTNQMIGPQLQRVTVTIYYHSEKTNVGDYSYSLVQFLPVASATGDGSAGAAPPGGSGAGGGGGTP